MRIALIGVKSVVSNVITGTLKKIHNSELSIHAMGQAEDDWAFIADYDVLVINLNASSVPVKALLISIRKISDSIKIIGIHNYSNKKIIMQLMEAGLDAYIEQNQVYAQLPDTIKGLFNESAV